MDKKIPIQILILLQTLLLVPTLALALILILLLVSAVIVVATANIAISARKRRKQTQLPSEVETQPTLIAQPYLADVDADQTLMEDEAKPESIIKEEKTTEAQEESQPASTIEPQTQLVYGADTIVPKQTQPIAEDFEVQQTAEEGTQSRAAMGQECPEGGVPAPPAQRERLAPEQRGGKPRGLAKNHERAPKTSHGSFRPEVICWKREGQWIVGVEIPEELLEGSNNPQLLQYGAPLTRDDREENRWLLEQVSGEVVVRWNGGEEVQETKVTLGQESYLLFKLSAQRESQGRHIKSPSIGSYLAVVPKNWERDDAVSGSAPVMPECVSIDGYKAHFFELGNDDKGKIAFRTSNGEQFLIESNKPRFELVGNKLKDASENIGPLFGGGPPRIRARDVETWRNIGKIVSGEEGSGRGKWRTYFSPKQDSVEQDLPYEVTARKGGWYFLRFYDTKDELIESLDFRFLFALKDISIHCSSPFPSMDGHRPIKVEFHHDSGCVVQPVSHLTNIPIEPQDGKTVLTIPPDPACDETPWRVGFEDGPQVEVTILVERLWWTVGEENKPPQESEWKDQPFTLQRDDFTATSKKALWVRLPKHRWVDKILVGFEQPKARPYKVRVKEETTQVPLREFGDSKELEDRTQQHNFKVWIEVDEGYREGIAAVIPASQLAISPAPVRVVSHPPPPYWVGVGRYKTAVAKAVLQHGSCGIKVNEHPMDDYFKRTPTKAKHFLQSLLELDLVRDLLSRIEVRIAVEGSNAATVRQAKAAAHALARGLWNYDPKLKPVLKQTGFGGAKVTKLPTMRQRG